MASIEQRVFFELIKVGLWSDHGRAPGEGFMVNDSLFKSVDWDSIYQLAQEQSMQGIVLRGIEELRAKGFELSVPRVLLLQWIGEVQVIEQQNKDMNAFIAKLIDTLRKNDIYALLVKGQGLAQCYETPLWRSSGDVDLLLDEKDYYIAKKYLCQKASFIEDENKHLHLGMMIDGWNVEIHGTLRSGSLKRMDAIVDNVQQNLFKKKDIHVWRNENTNVLLPNPDDNIIFVFTHIIKHFFHEGIGLRQVCDWCRLLYTYRDLINRDLLELRIREAGLTTEWNTFGAFAVEYMGMQEAVMPRFCKSESQNDDLKKKTNRICKFILMTGNFGHNRDFSYYSKKSLIYQKTKSFIRHTSDSLKRFIIFPLDTLAVWNRMLLNGIKAII